MTDRFAIAPALLALTLLAGCGQGSGGNSGAAAPAGAAGSVATKAPPAGQQWVDVVSRTPEGGYRMGNPDAPLKLIEYGSRSCPHCAAFDAEGLPELKAKYIASGKLSYEFRDFPVHNELDFGPILLGQCVEPAQFFPMLDQMMQNQTTLLADMEKKLTAEDQKALQGKTPNQVATVLAQKLGYVDFVKQRGVPEAKALACLGDKGALDTLAKNLQVANDKFQVSGTPTFILNGQKLDDTADWAKLQPALKNAGA